MGAVDRPANADGFGTADEQAVRLRVFCDHYGLDDAGRAVQIDTVVARLQSLVDFMRTQAAAGHAAFASHLRDGRHLQYLADAEYVVREPTTFERRLTAA